MRQLHVDGNPNLLFVWASIQMHGRPLRLLVPTLCTCHLYNYLFFGFNFSLTDLLCFRSNSTCSMLFYSLKLNLTEFVCSRSNSTCSTLLYGFNLNLTDLLCFRSNSTCSTSAVNATNVESGFSVSTTSPQLSSSQPPAPTTWSTP